MVAVEDISKKSLRKYAKFLRQEINNKEKKERIITQKLLKLEQIKKSKNILVYISLKDEVSTEKLIKELLKENKNVYAPKIVNKTMDFYRITSLNELEYGKYNILEPTSKIKYKNDDHSSIIVPGLLFDKENNRLGYGCGYYDRFLENNNIYKIGICFKDFLVDKIETNEYDIKMDEVITEE